ncbi:hypothetical protein [Cognatishimia activa]|uniref:hypothetical protein n=1 Tax=Cognatishimia activa TaxID=1715691 RepID=UPI0022301641|nr:hypothetical protein [Cognatishimia activa]UZD92230.1 hypothetical protein M0D42_06370 [Cognatishimia activa]
MVLYFFVFIWPLSMLALSVYCFFFLRNRLLAAFMPLSLLGIVTILMSRRWSVERLEKAECVKGEALAFDCSKSSTYGIDTSIAETLLTLNTAALIYLYLVFPFLVVLLFYIQYRKNQDN